MRYWYPLINQKLLQIVVGKKLQTPKDMNRQFTKDKI